VPRTSTTANALLGLLALRPEWPAWALATQLRRNMRFFWPRAESRVFDELKRLADDGVARTRRESNGRRQRTNYAITAAGRRRLKRWLATPPSPTALECEPLLRVMLAELSDIEHTRAAVAQVRVDADAILEVGRVVGREYIDGTAPFQAHVAARALVFDFLAHHALALRAWADRADAALDDWRTDPESRDQRAVDAISSCLAAFPPSDEAASTPARGTRS
jgi:DNA-binding PadR family transcriptional regulator